MEPQARLAVLKALGDNTRYAIYLELARSPSPLSTIEIAETLGLHANTVRPHLERMREVGLLDVEIEARGAVGRPQHRYSLAADAPSLGLEPAAFPLLARLLVTAAAGAGVGGEDAAAASREQGRAMATRTRGDGSGGGTGTCAQALTRALNELGSTRRWPRTASWRPSRSPTARTGSWPRPTPSWSATCTGGWLRVSWKNTAVQTLKSSARSWTESRVRSFCRLNRQSPLMRQVG